MPVRVMAGAALRRRFAVALGCAVLVAGCVPGGSPAPASTGVPSASAPASASGGPSPSVPGASPVDALAVYRTIADQVSTIRGLDAPDRVEPRIIDRDQLRVNFQREFDAENPPARLEPTERLDKALGLLAPDASLRNLLLELDGGQIIGYYDPTVDELFIVSQTGSLGATERATYAHEFTHELQDLHFDLNSLGLDASGNSDRSLAVLALVEGDAVSAQTTWMTQNFGLDDLAQLAADASDPEVVDVLARTPSILRETSLFPYSAGASFVDSLLSVAGYATVDAAYADLPTSTTEILHPEAYLAGWAPADVAIPDRVAGRLGPGWSVVAADTLGELQLRVWLREGLVDGTAARVAAAGWDGDRVVLLAGPGTVGDGVMLLSEWDTAGDADEFRAAAVDALAGLGLHGAAVTVGRHVAVGILPVGASQDLTPILADLATGTGAG